ncbi:type VII secretion integral membrane protein EccD [Kineosporia babensis]|uniref:Type VII secretion integral membrane protein EccD n=1 Tax=Kineosporia babensis TaxID=499548 RepID=A0A9X1N7W6_9ACTN|nr:type VII secretion integral membrane protein EccD [Kineosporia babensis]MCD5309997.1 type VII secretion integral membrane protein EccD [Kineosporia babensis]
MTAVTDRVGLARVVVMTPKRRLTVALPEQIPVAALLPALLRQGGEDLAVDGLATGGWVLRKVDGTALDATRGLAPQGISDGELLCLVPLNQEWPEPEYDDVVDVIADGARRAQRAWTPAFTRACGLGVTVASVVLLTVVLLLTPGSTGPAAIVLLALAAVLTIGGAALSRVLADAKAGAVVAAPAGLVALAGGVLLAQGPDQPWLGPGQLMTGAAAMLLFSVAGLLGVAERRHIFIGSTVTALGALAGAALVTIWPGTVDRVDAAAVVTTVLLLLSPAFPLLSVRLARIPLPSVPRDMDDLRSNDTGPAFPDVVVRVVRSTDILTGLMLGTALITVTGLAILAADGSTVPLVLAGLIALAHLLRARMLVAARQRLMPLLTGLLGLAVTVAGTGFALGEAQRLAYVVPFLVLVAIGSCAAALVYSRQQPSPRAGRWADIFDVLLTLATAPLTASVLGLYAYVRGLAG